MWEKNFGRKVLSLSPDDDNFGDCINDDDDAVTVKETKRSKRKKRSADEHCDTCDQNITLKKKRNSLNCKDSYLRKLAQESCEDHEDKYSNHKCTPHWCGDCGFLIKYEVILIEHVDKSVDE